MSFTKLNTLPVIRRLSIGKTTYSLNVSVIINKMHREIKDINKIHKEINNYLCKYKCIKKNSTHELK